MNREYWDGFEDYELKEEHDIDDFVEELANKVSKAFSGLEDRYHPAYLGLKNSSLLYGLIREKKPEVVIETGVCNGMSSAVILKALDDNGEGKLYSIDLPVKAGSIEGRTGAVLPPEKESGWVVPKGLRQCWELKLGNTYYELPKLFERIGDVDIFLHDSGHSYETMMFEFGIAWSHLKEEGLLLADNTDKNRAFLDFAKAQGRTPYRLNVLALVERCELR